MKKLVGGDYLLDLTPIEIEESVDGATKTNITNKDVITQLTNLKNYIRNPEMIKPVWVLFNNGETDEKIVVRGQLSVVDTGEFEICVSVNGYKLRLFIEFTQVLNADSQPLDDWYIDTNDAKYLFTSDAQNIGAISELPVFENIVDAQGHKRFIDGDGTPATIEGLTTSYCKWSLSGSHLMCVFAGTLAENTEIENGLIFCTFTIPEWISEKIYNVWSEYIESKTMTAIASDWSTQTSGYVYGKLNDGRLFLQKTNGSLVADKDRNFRIAFDLLIDNVAPESQGE